MTFKELIPYLKYLHSFYNFLMMVLFFYLGFLGLRIRRERKAGTRTPKIIKRHRKNGPILALMGALGFFSGAISVYILYGKLLIYPLHFLTGLILLISIFTAFLTSKKIRGSGSPFRTPHFVIGILILILYLIQTILGLGMLF